MDLLLLPLEVLLRMLSHLGMLNVAKMPNNLHCGPFLTHLPLSLP
jgi:hypothetical protein